MAELLTIQERTQTYKHAAELVEQRAWPETTTQLEERREWVASNTQAWMTHQCGRRTAGDITWRREVKLLVAGMLTEGLAHIQAHERLLARVHDHAAFRKALDHVRGAFRELHVMENDSDDEARAVVRDFENRLHGCLRDFEVPEPVRVAALLAREAAAECQQHDAGAGPTHTIAGVVRRGTDGPVVLLALRDAASIKEAAAALAEPDGPVEAEQPCGCVADGCAVQL